METANGTTTEQNGSTQHENGEYKLRFCTVCASNNNRSVLIADDPSCVLPNMNSDPWKLISDSHKPITL
jgi:hypothetical protein